MIVSDDTFHTLLVAVGAALSIWFRAWINSYYDRKRRREEEAETEKQTKPHAHSTSAGAGGGKSHRERGR